MPALTQGLKLDGATFEHVDVCVGDTFGEAVPVAAAVGIPLMVKRLGKGSAGSHYPACRMMTSPDIGLAPARWQFGGMLGPCPVVVFARTDGVPFGTREWAVLDAFIAMQFDCEGREGPRHVTRQDFTDYLERRDEAGTVFLDVRYPRGARVRAICMDPSEQYLNGETGVCTGECTHGWDGRVMVQFREPFGRRAVRPKHLITVQPVPQP